MKQDEKETLLFFGPHPDDIFISCGGHIIKNIERYNIHVVCLVSSGMKPSDEIRINEEKKTWTLISERFNQSIVFDSFNGRDTFLHESYCDLVSFVENILTKCKNVKHIYAPFHYDTHQDHRTTTEAILSACRYSKNIIFYETPSTYDFYPKIFSEMNNEIISLKTEISKNYTSQILGNNTYSVDLPTLIESKAISNGMKTRVCKFAEGFIPFRMFFE